MVAGFSRDPSDWTATELADARAIIRSGLRKFYHPPVVDGSIHQWRFLERQESIAGEAVYDTGTVTIVDGVVTLAGGTFTSWAADAIIRVGGNTYYVASRDSDTQLTLAQTHLDAAALTTFELYRWRWGVPADFGELIDGVVYHNGDSRSRRLLGATEHEIRLRLTANWQVGDPQRFAIFAGSDADVSDWYFSAWPIFDSAGYAIFTYRKTPLDNLDATDLTADGAVVQVEAVHAETLLAAIQAATEEYYNDEVGGAHGIRFIERLRASIAHDRHTAGPVEFERDDNRLNMRRRSLLYHTPEYL